MDMDDFTPDPDEEKDRNFVTALARGLDVLRCFRRGETELTNTDISERTGLPKATVSRLTHTLVKLDYLVPNTRTGTYRLGAGVLKLGLGVLCAIEIGERAQDEMRKLCDGPNSYVTVALGERHRSDVIYVAVERSVEDVSLSMHVGSLLPLFFSAIGRAILAGLDAEARDAVTKAADVRDPDGAALRRNSVARALSEYRSQGYCCSFGDWRPDVNGIAVPVFTLGGSRVYGLNIGGPSFHLKKRQLETLYAPRLIAASERLSVRV